MNPEAWKDEAVGRSAQAFPPRAPKTGAAER